MSKKYNWGCVLNKKRKAVCEDEDDEEDDDDSKKPNIIIARTPVISGINIMGSIVRF